MARGAALDLPLGVYEVRVPLEGEPLKIPNVEIGNDSSTTVELKKEGNEIRAHVQGPTP